MFNILSDEELQKAKDEVNRLRKQIEYLEDAIRKTEETINKNKMYTDRDLNKNNVLEPPYECCKHCNNHPANNPNASGFCSCMLPYLERTGTVRY